MKIGQVAADADVTVDTVRFYERRGVLPPPERRPSGYREYTPAAVERIRMARDLQQLGLTLDEIIDALHAHDAGGERRRQPALAPGSRHRPHRRQDRRPAAHPEQHHRHPRRLPRRPMPVHAVRALLNCCVTPLDAIMRQVGTKAWSLPLSCDD